MTEGPGFLEFFILEASDYVEQLDGLLLGGSSSGPDADAMQRVARALRGTATMAKLSSFAEVAGGVERVGRALQEGMLQWDPAVGGALVAAVDDLKALLHNARSWSPAEDQRANSRTAELARFAPPLPFTPPRDRGNERASVAGSQFLAAEASNIAAGLELLNTRGGAADTAANLLRRVRGLRGVAGVKEVGPLADVLEATEDATRGLELGETLTPEGRRLLEASAEYLRGVSSALRFGGDVEAPGAARDAFFGAHERWATKASEQARVVPISTLFYVDGGPGVVEVAESPPTSAAARFRLELVSHGEHLRQVIDSARRAVDASATDRARRDVRRALRALEMTAESFGERTVAELISARATLVDDLDARSLAALDDVASALSDSGAQSERLIARLRELAGQKPKRTSAELREVAAPANAGANVAASAASAPAPTGSEPAADIAPAARSRTPLPAMLDALVHDTPLESVAIAATELIDSGLAALEVLTSEPWIPPVAIPEEVVVPIETLLYRGRSALDRAVEIRDSVRRSGRPIDTATLEELFDLLELAQAE